MRSLTATLVALLLALVIAPTANAEETAPTLTWSVRPATESGQDNRSWVELELDPGASAVDHLAVRNLSAEAVTFTLTAADGYFTPTGRFNMKASDVESTDAGTWIDVQDTVTVDANGTAIVPFTVTVPEVVEPGDHAAGIAASVRSEQAGSDGTKVGVESRVGFRVMTRVTGELAPAAAIENVDADYTLSWNPFAPGSMTVSFDVVNAGNARFTVGGSVSANGRSVSYPDADAATQELLPGDSRALSATVEGVWPLFLLPTEVLMTPTVVTPDGSTVIADSAATTVQVWAMPWPQLLVLLGVALIVLALFGGRIRSRRKLDTLLEQARAEGARAAAVEPDPARQD
ncbi:DUF916 domain-containing protein [Microbacteriaceae bacterium VKM Ac-2855]|nr:DUF916 domain-containing protein [Microbacteriaceae bacterium VKM Ac-2855]